MSELRQPSFRVYSAIPGKGADEGLIDIGLCYPRPDGKGLDVVLQALPLSAELVLREIEGSQAKFASEKVDDARPKSLKEQLNAYERALIEQCLQDAGGVIGAVLEWLDVPRRTLSEKMKRLGIDAASYRQGRRRRLLGQDRSAGPSMLDAGGQTGSAQ
jgi:Bacterial regulatory protein, Fis family